MVNYSFYELLLLNEFYMNADSIYEMAILLKAFATNALLCISLNSQLEEAETHSNGSKKWIHESIWESQRIPRNTES